MRLGRDTRLGGKILVGGHPVQRLVWPDAVVEGLIVGEGRGGPRDSEVAVVEVPELGACAGSDL